MCSSVAARDKDVADSCAGRYRRLMAIPAAHRDVALRQIAIFCENFVPGEDRDSVRLEHGIQGDHITIVERRPPWSELVGPDWTSLNVAQLRYDERSRTWSLYACDRDDRWFLYIDVAPAADIGPLLAEIAEDPTGIFWG
jgi:hypothetical protein